MADNKEILKMASQAIKDLVAERDFHKLSFERTERQERILGKMVESGAIKTAAEYVQMSNELKSSGNEEAVEKALELFPGGPSTSIGKVAQDSIDEGLSAEQKFLSVVLS